MRIPPQLNPVHAWLLGFIDTATLCERSDFDVTAPVYGRALVDEEYAAELLAEAQRLLDPEPPPAP